jgi:hypothetical protein
LFVGGRVSIDAGRRHIIIIGKNRLHQFATGLASATLWHPEHSDAWRSDSRRTQFRIGRVTADW